MYTDLRKEDTPQHMFQEKGMLCWNVLHKAILFDDLKCSSQFRFLWYERQGISFHRQTDCSTLKHANKK